jgi:Mandelate racemase / muconate lactonizing enzyme, N-terminal domain/Enolase C-terminal domain-like
MSASVPEKKRHRTDLGTKVKSDATLILVETDNGLTGIGAALGTPPIIAAIVEHELVAECFDEDPMFSERIYEKMYNGSRSRPALARGITQADESRRHGVIMEAIAGIDIAVWDVKAQALGIPLYQALGAARSSVRGYASGGWAPGDEAEGELADYAAKGFTAAKMRVVGRDGFSISNCVRRVKAARRGLGPNVELMIDAPAGLVVKSSSGSSWPLLSALSDNARTQRLHRLEPGERGLQNVRQSLVEQPLAGRRLGARPSHSQCGMRHYNFGKSSSLIVGLVAPLFAIHCPGSVVRSFAQILFSAGIALGRLLSQSCMACISDC